MNPSKPFVSVIIPAYNAASHLAGALDSILAQDYRPLEVIVVDDGSTDDTAGVARRYAKSAVRCVAQPHAGFPFALNTGLKNATGDLICFLDSDDVWTLDKLDLQIPLILDDPSADIVLSHQQRAWKPQGCDEFKFKEPELALHLQSCVFRRRAFEKVGPFDTSFKHQADWDWFLRARELELKFIVHAEVTNIYRRHGDNFSDSADAVKDVPLMFKRSLERRRARGGKGAALSLPGMLESLRSASRSAIPERAKNSTQNVVAGSLGRAVQSGLVSVVIPAYQAGKYIAEAIESVRAQTYRPIETIVVDDGSSDDTRAVVERYGSSVQYLWQPNAGISAARNRGVELVSGEFLAFLDADDLWLEDKLAWQTEVLRTRAELDMVFGYVLQFPSPELAEEDRSKLHYIAEPSPAYLGGAMLIRREAFLRTASFDEQWQVAEFVDWYLRAMDSGLRSEMQPRTALKRRLHDANQGIKKRDARVDYVRVVRAALDRRKAKAAAQNSDVG